jgi:hypothetical protein
MPRVSIITPLHNKGPYVAETIRSVQAQTLTDWEMIVVENHSSDDGPVQVEALAATDARTRFIRAPESVRGPGAARNLGLKEARGEWVLFLDADDLIQPDYLEGLLAKAAEAPDATIIATPWAEFQEGAPLSAAVTKYPAGMMDPGMRLVDYAIAHTCWAVHSAMVKRFSLGEKPWPEELDGYLAEDTAFWFGVVCDAKVAYSGRTGALYRTQTASCRTNFSAEAWFEGNHRAVCQNLAYLASLGKEPTPGQKESLVRHYEGLYESARQEGNRIVEARALREARSWLAKLRQSSRLTSAALRLRHHLGIPSFVVARRFLNKMKATSRHA